MLSNRSRRRTGNFICELPLVVWVLILCFFLPLFDLASIAMHVCSVNAAARDAARVAGRAASYSQATAAAANQARLTIATGPAGVRLLSVATVVVATPLNGGTPLASADRSWPIRSSLSISSRSASEHACRLWCR